MNNKKDKNLVDMFLDGYSVANDESSNMKYKKIYRKPSKVKCIIGFIFCLLILIILIRHFVFKLIFFLILIGDILILLFYGINLFTKKGWGLPKYIKVDPNTSDINKL